MTDSVLLHVASVLLYVANFRICCIFPNAISASVAVSLCATI
jgi:hypothetical protein